MEYRIAEGFSRESIEEEIRKLLDDGWKLEGNLVACTITPSNRIHLFQAMTKGKQDEFIGVMPQ